MRILQLTPGTGNFHCGSCLRDHALVKALRKRGHEVIMAPMYLPQVLEDSDRVEATPEIFFGGINVYLEQKLGVFRYTPGWVDRLFNRPGLLRFAANCAGMTKAHDLGQMTLSMLEGEHGRQAKEIEKLVAWAKTEAKFDLISLSNVMLAGIAHRLKEALDVPIVCTLQGEAPFLGELPDAYRDKAWELLRERVKDIDRFIAVSEYYGELMRDKLGFPAEQMDVVHNAIDLTGFEPVEPYDKPIEPVIGYLARMCPEKGLETLVDAFMLLHEQYGQSFVKLHIAGAQTKADLPFAMKLQKKINRAGLRKYVHWTPNLTREEKQAMLRRLTVFSVPATYGESFGLYVLEALASGVPVVQPEHGAFPELLTRTGGGMLVQPDDPVDLACSLNEMVCDVSYAQMLGEEGRATVLEQFGMERMAKDIEAAYVKTLSDDVAEPSRTSTTNGAATSAAGLGL